MKALLSLTVMILPICAAWADTKTADAVDPYQWLEDTDGPKPLDWVKARNAETVRLYAATPAFEKMKSEILEVLDSDAKIPYVTRRGNYLYNLWQDKLHPRGLWRRTTLDEYRKEKPSWTTLLDLDALGKAEHQGWVWGGSYCLKPENRHCLIRLSRGGSDAVVVREYDLVARGFAKGGFSIPESKTFVSWKDANTIYVGTDFGPGSMTKSGYPRLCKLWRRGTPLRDAKLVFAGKADDKEVICTRDNTPGFERDFVNRNISFFESESFLIGRDGSLTAIDMPIDAEFDEEREWILFRTRTPWTVGGKTYVAGALLAAKFDDWIGGKRELTLLFEPTPTKSLSNFNWTRNHLILNELEDVVGRVEILTPQDGPWTRQPLGGAPELTDVSAMGSDIDRSDEYFMYVTGYLTPTTFKRGIVGQGDPEELKHSPYFFDASRYSVERDFAKSKDGTRIPYFAVMPKNVTRDGRAPTLLSGYGGFEAPLYPYYDAAVGRAWLERGGIYVVANIRGGGEYGPRWHEAALRQNRPRAYEDFAAVAQQLIADKLTSPQHLGIAGASNGGLLVGNMLIQYSQLFGAVVSEIPLLDMKRYTHLAAGSSWIAEYGNPDLPSDWSFIQTFSPYQNVKKETKYPPVLFWTTTRDDRVGPAHARKMAAKMLDLHHDVAFYENIEGGHGAGADNEQEAFMNALTYSFLWAHLK